MKIKVFIRTNKVGSDCIDFFEVDDEEWSVLSESEKEEWARDTAFNYLEWGWEECPN